MANVGIQLNEDGYGPCPRCGGAHVGHGTRFHNTDDDVEVETHCLQCDFEIVGTAPFGSSARRLEGQRKRWNELSLRQYKDGSERRYALYRIATALRAEGERLIKQADAIQREADTLSGRYRNHAGKEHDE